MKKVFSIEGIDCANCAAKIEEKINKIKEVDEAVLNFMTSKLTIVCEDSVDFNKIMMDVEKIVAKIEPDAKIS